MSLSASFGIHVFDMTDTQTQISIGANTRAVQYKCALCQPLPPNLRLKYVWCVCVKFKFSH